MLTRRLRIWSRRTPMRRMLLKKRNLRRLLFRSKRRSPKKT
jgi:hypothetical protein